MFDLKKPSAIHNKVTLKTKEAKIGKSSLKQLSSEEG
jgi:hypothetical protein